MSEYKAVLIAGVSSGIGRAAALAFKARGWYRQGYRWRFAVEWRCADRNGCCHLSIMPKLE
ncbi:hypothetical protein ACTVPT_09205 [Serratia bockelmannii]|uniref:hypothetical protein n=1 Tax=Serratia bockelmannii TaxID=2703793 RepID=UPI003FA77647